MQEATLFGPQSAASDVTLRLAKQVDQHEGMLNPVDVGKEMPVPVGVLDVWFAVMVGPEDGVLDVWFVLVVGPEEGVLDVWFALMVDPEDGVLEADVVTGESGVDELEVLEIGDVVLEEVPSLEV